jgi:hypothetical protein
MLPYSSNWGEHMRLPEPQCPRGGGRGHATLLIHGDGHARPAGLLQALRGRCLWLLLCILHVSCRPHGAGGLGALPLRRRSTFCPSHHLQASAPCYLHNITSKW